MNGDIKIHLPIYQLLARRAEIKGSLTKERQEGAQNELLRVLCVPRSQGKSGGTLGREGGGGKLCKNVWMWQQRGWET